MMDAFMLIFADKPIFLTETKIQLMREQIYSNAQSDTTHAATPTQPHRLNYTRGEFMEELGIHQQRCVKIWFSIC